MKNKINENMNDAYKQFLDYEIKSSRILGLISIRWMQVIAAIYISRKVVKKVNRYLSVNMKMAESKKTN
jgi:hypothetical protein